MDAKLTVLVVAPGKAPEVKEISNEIKALQKAVGGYVQMVTIGKDIVLLCDEEGKISGKPYNRVIRNEAGKIVDIICGTFLICAVDRKAGEFTSITDKDIRIYEQCYRTPERIWISNGSIFVEPIATAQEEKS